MGFRRLIAHKHRYRVELVLTHHYFMRCDKRFCPFRFKTVPKEDFK